VTIDASHVLTIPLFKLNLPCTNKFDAYIQQRAMGQGLFELRCKGKEGIGRAFYCTMVGREIVVLHCFIKKTQDTPDKELAIARKRLKEVLNGQ